VWTRRGDSNIFDAVWRNTRTNAEQRETVTMDSAERGHVVLHPSTGNQTMEGTYSPDLQNHLSGYLTSGPHWYWEAVILDDHATDRFLSGVIRSDDKDLNYPNLLKNKEGGTISREKMHFGAVKAKRLILFAFIFNKLAEREGFEP
jgi:hypothetical protein